MNVLNRHGYFGDLLAAWNTTGNDLYPRYFDALVRDWVTHLPCNNASFSTTPRPAFCAPLGAKDSGDPWAAAQRTCAWDAATAGGACSTSTFESPWRSLEMGVRMLGAWPQAFFGFQGADSFSVDGRVLLLLGVSEHFQGLVSDGGHAGRGTVNWEMTQWQGLLAAAGAWPEVAGASAAAATAIGELEGWLVRGVYADGVETEMASGYDMGTAADYLDSLLLIQRAGLPPAPRSYVSHVEAMWDYGAYVADGAGCLPQNGDSDFCGQGFSTAAARYFGRADWDWVRTNGKFGTKPSGPGHATPSAMFPWAGQAVLRSGYERNNTWAWFDVGPFGSNAFHAHRDKLSLQLHAFGAQLLIDSGIFAYAGSSFSHARRPYGHETHAHNTLRIDGKQQSQSPQNATAPRPPASWSYEADHDVVQGSMSQYDGLVGHAAHARSIYHQRGGWLVVVDVVTSDRGGRAVQATWHCHPNASVAHNSTTGAAVVGGVDAATGLRTPARVAVIPALASCAGGGGGGCTSSTSGTSGANRTSPWGSSKIVKGQLAGKDGATEDQGWYSRSYADAAAAPVLVYDQRLAPGQKQAVFVWLLLPAPSPAAMAANATATVTGVEHGAVSVTVRVGGAGTGPVRIRVPFEIVASERRRV